jgi:hypothetical protein
MYMQPVKKEEDIETVLKVQLVGTAAGMPRMRP